jgi:hypothetical protein
MKCLEEILQGGIGQHSFCFMSESASLCILSARVPAKTTTKQHPRAIVFSLCGEPILIITMDDDLDAFFDDVENAVKEVQEEERTDNEPPVTTTAVEKDTSSSSASVIKSQKTKATDQEIEEAEQQRPVKRAKVVAASSGAVKNIVVASSVPVVSVLPPPPTAPSKSVSAAPPPPPPPPLPPGNNYGATTTTTYYHNNTPAQQHIDNNVSSNTTDKQKTHVRTAAGKTWSDPTLTQWPPNDFRLFVGNLAKDLKESDLSQAFSKYPSFAMSRIMYNKTDGKSRGYGFVSVLDPKDCARAIREMNQSWLGSRPIQVKRSEWKDMEWKEVQKKKKRDGRNKKHFGV